MKIKIFTTLLALVLLGCEKKSNIEFKYADQEDLFECSNVDMDLIKEAVYSFEAFLDEHYDFRKQNQRAITYTNFLRNAQSEMIPMAEFFDDHMKSIVSELKKHPDLWIDKGDDYSLNYSHPVVKCISDNLGDQQFKSVFDAMAFSNTLRPGLIGPSLIDNADQIDEVKAMSTYMALDMFYSKVLILDLSMSKEELSKHIGALNYQRVGHQHR